MIVSPDTSWPVLPRLPYFDISATCLENEPNSSPWEGRRDWIIVDSSVTHFLEASSKLSTQPAIFPTRLGRRSASSLLSPKFRCLPFIDTFSFHYGKYFRELPFYPLVRSRHSGCHLRSDAGWLGLRSARLGETLYSTTQWPDGCHTSVTTVIVHDVHCSAV